MTGARIRSMACLALLLLTACGKEPHSVVDEAELLTLDQSQRVAAFHRFLLIDYDIDYRVLTVRQPIDINDYAGRRFESLQVGSNSKGGRGLLLVIDTQGNRVRLEVSRALESVYPDAFIAYIEHRQMTPFFAVGRIADGVLASTELIVTRAQHADASQGWDDETWSHAVSDGGGATAPALLGTGTDASTPVAKSTQPPEADSVVAVLGRYFQAMSGRNADAGLNFYSAQTRNMLKKWVVTAAQMDSIIRAYRACQADAVRYDERVTLAVIRYRLTDRACSPWYFVREGGNWRLDLVGAQRYIRFGRDNSWHFDRQMPAQHSYRFAFADWGFDTRGYPQAIR